MKVAALRTLERLDPELEQILEAVALTARPPSILISRLETLLGPLGSERLEEIIDTHEMPWQDKLVADHVIDKIAALFEASLRPRAIQELTREWDITRQHVLT